MGYYVIQCMIGEECNEYIFFTSYGVCLFVVVKSQLWTKKVLRQLRVHGNGMARGVPYLSTTQIQ